MQRTLHPEPFDGFLMTWSKQLVRVRTDGVILAVFVVRFSR